RAREDTRQAQAQHPHTATLHDAGRCAPLLRSAAVLLQILLVEDEPDTRKFVAEALTEAGHDVVEAVDGAAAVERASLRAFDLVVCDLRLPKVAGLTVFRKSRHLSPRTDVILMTSFGDVAEAVAALKEGAYDYLTKPFDPDELVLRVGAIATRR